MVPMESFQADRRIVEVFPSQAPSRPIVYLNTFQGMGERVLRELRARDCPDVTLVAISGLDWNHDIAPWAIPPISSDDTPCTGGADGFLELLAESIIPKTEASLPAAPIWRGIAGYSLAGLFAVYATFKTALFSRVASMSGSLWFPGFMAFTDEREPMRLPGHLYLSLGGGECRSENPYLACVEANTLKVRDDFAARGVDTCFRLNPGDHYTQPIERTAAGIRWLVERG